MFDQFRCRSNELEHMDIGDYTPEEYEGCLAELRRINRWLGDVNALRHSLLADVRRSNLQHFSVLDVGAGSGELLRTVATWAQGETRQARLVGLELNPSAAAAILAESRQFNGIAAVRGDVFRLPFATDAFDYVICSLFTHHFRDEEVVAVLREFSRVARRRIFVIDLYRHPVAYYLYTVIARLFLHNRLTREDGALSILRSFKPKELWGLANRASLSQVNVSHDFPFRLVLSGSKE